MNIFNVFKKYINKDVIIQCIEYYEDNDVFLKIDDSYNSFKNDLLSKKRISYQDMQNFLTNTRGSSFTFFKKYNPFLYKAFHGRSINNDIEHTFPFQNSICIKPNFQDFSQNKKLIKLLNENMDKQYLIIDLRHSSGGSIKTCANLCNILLPKCEIFTQKFKNKIITYVSDENYYKFKKVFILVDQFTASSSEILAYSLKMQLDNSFLIGSKTFGKMCGQDIITNKKHRFIFSIVSFLWHIKDFSYEDTKISKPSTEDYMEEVKKYI